MKVFAGTTLLFSLAVAVLAEPVVDRLVSRRHLSSLARRGSGFSNGGKAENSGKGKDGKLKNKSNYELSFYHINDVHAHLDEYRPSGASCTDTTLGCVAGYSRVRTVINQSRPTKNNSLFLNAGDEFQGTLFYTLYKGEKIAETLNQLGFDAMTLGNHEFDDGDDLLANFLHNLTFPVISSNVHTKNPKLASALVPYKVFSEHHLAVLAVTTETTATISNPSNLTTFEDPVVAAQRTVKFIKQNHPFVKRIVALTHIGYDKDIELAKATTDISLIIGGHSHTLLGDMAGAKGAYPTIATNLDGDEVFVVTSYRWGEYLSYIDVEYDLHGKIISYEGAPIHLTNTTQEEPTLKAQVKQWEEAFKVYGSTILGFTETLLVQSTCQLGECTLGDFTADAMEAYRPNENLAGAIANAGGMRTEIDAGNITLQNALDCFPFGNSLVEIEFTGSELWDAFEGIVSKKNVVNGLPVASFVQVSKSIKFTYNPDNAIGSKLITLTIKGQPVVLSQTYLISTIDYLATGGDGFFVPRSSIITLETLADVWAKHVQAVTPIKYELDGRISTTTETVPQKGV